MPTSLGKKSSALVRPHEKECNVFSNWMRWLHKIIKYFKSIRQATNKVGWATLPLLYIVLVCVLLALISQPILAGDVTASRYWLSASFQGIATIFALLTSAFLIIGQLASQLYPQRVAARMYKSPLVLFHTLGGVFLLMFLLLPQTSLRDGVQYSIWVQWAALAFVLMYLCGVPVVINVAFSMLRPVKVLNSSLDRINSQLLCDLNARYGEHNFAPRFIEEDPILELETIIAAFFRQEEPQYVSVAISGLFKRLGAVSVPSDYEAVAHHFGPSMRQLGRMIIEKRHEELMRQLCAAISNIHKKLYNASYSSESEYERKSFPRVLLGLIEDCVVVDFREGAAWGIVALGWAEPVDRKYLAKDIANGRFKDFLAKKAGNALVEHARQEWAEDFRYTRYSALYIREIGSIIEERSRKHCGDFLPELIRHYDHLTYGILELNAESHSLAREDLLNSIVFNLRGVVPAAASSGNLNPYDVVTLTSLADTLLRGQVYHPAVSLTKLNCDAVLRAVGTIKSCSELTMPVIHLTVNGLCGIDEAPGGADVAKVVGQTLLKLSDVLPAQYAQEGLGDEYESLFRELGSRIKQLLDGKLGVVDPELANKLREKLRENWPGEYAGLQPTV